MFTLLGLSNAVDLTSALAAALSDSPEPEAVVVLERLVDVHLLATPGPGRYRLHDLVRVAAREFADQMLTSAEREAANTRWLRRVSAVVWKASEYAGHGVTRETWIDKEWMVGADDLPTYEDVLVWLDRERPSLVAAVQQAAQDQPPLAIQLAIGLNAYYALRRAWLEWQQVNEAAQRLVTGGRDRIAEALVLHDLGAANAELGQYERAVEPLRKAVDAAEASGDGNLQALCLSSLSHVLERTGRVADGIPYAERAREIGLRLGIPPRAAWACLALGMLYLKTGEGEAAQRHFTEAMELLTEPGQEKYRGLIAQNVGVAYREAGRFDIAAETLHESLELYREGRRRDPAGRSTERTRSPPSRRRSLHRRNRLAERGFGHRRPTRRLALRSRHPQKPRRGPRGPGRAQPGPPRMAHRPLHPRTTQRPRRRMS